MKTRYVLATLVLALGLSACGSSSVATSNVLALPDLASIEALEVQFNENSGTPRLILILSPT